MSWYVPNTGVVPADLTMASVSEGATSWPGGVWSRGGDSSEGAGAKSGSGRTLEAGSPCWETAAIPSTEALRDTVAYAENRKIQS